MYILDIQIEFFKPGLTWHMNRGHSHGQFDLTPQLECFLCLCSLGNIPQFSLFFELMEGTSPIHFRAGSHFFLLSVFLCRFDEPVKLFPVGFIIMMLIHFQLLAELYVLKGVRDLRFNLMPTLGYLCWHCNKPIDKAPVFLPFVLVFHLMHHHRYVVCNSTASIS
jgi:hypothetical protein